MDIHYLPTVREIRNSDLFSLSRYFLFFFSNFTFDVTTAVATCVTVSGKAQWDGKGRVSASDTLVINASRSV